MGFLGGWGWWCCGLCGEFFICFGRLWCYGGVVDGGVGERVGGCGGGSLIDVWWLGVRGFEWLFVMGRAAVWGCG